MELRRLVVHAAVPAAAQEVRTEVGAQEVRTVEQAARTEVAGAQVEHIAAREEHIGAVVAREEHIGAAADKLVADTVAQEQLGPDIDCRMVLAEAVVAGLAAERGYYRWPRKLVKQRQTEVPRSYLVHQHTGCRTHLFCCQRSGPW